MIRNAAMYCATRVWITSQADQTTNSVVNAFSTTNSTEMPSTPRWYQTSKRGIHSARSTNCMPEAASSKWRNSGSVTTKPASAPASAIQRAAAASRSRPTARTARPATIGTQTASERYGVITCLSVKPGKQCEDADDHRERVVVDVTGLDVPQQRRAPADGARRSVDEEPVDDRAIADVRQERSKLPCPGAEDDFIETVEVVLVVQQRVDRAEPAADAFRECRIDDVAVIRRGDAGDREPERRRRQAVQHERGRAVPVGAKPGEHVVRGQNGNRVAEVAAEQHRLDMRPTGVDRRNGEQDQRHRDNPRGLLRRMLGVHTMMVVRVRLGTGFVR